MAEQRIRNVHRYQEGQVFPMSELGPFNAYYPKAFLPASIWQKAIDACQYARQMRNWSVADELRLQISY